MLMVSIELSSFSFHTTCLSGSTLVWIDLFWSDPDPRGRKGCRKNDDRKMACFFGADVTHQFLKKYNLSMIIRSHQVKQDGYEYNHDGKVLTVFSASNYCGGSNWGAVVRWFVISRRAGRGDIRLTDPCFSPIWQGLQRRRTVDHLVQNSRDGNGEIEFQQTVRWQGVRGWSPARIDLHRLTLFEDPAYHSLIEKIMTNKSSLMKKFEQADPTKTGKHLDALAAFKSRRRTCRCLTRRTSFTDVMVWDHVRCSSSGSSMANLTCETRERRRERHSVQNYVQWLHSR